MSLAGMAQVPARGGTLRKLVALSSKSGSDAARFDVAAGLNLAQPGSALTGAVQDEQL